MTLLWFEPLGVYVGWQKTMRRRKLHISCTKASIRAWYGPLELFWDWSHR